MQIWQGLLTLIRPPGLLSCPDEITQDFGELPRLNGTNRALTAMAM
jgi:hypothetical protein